MTKEKIEKCVDGKNHCYKQAIYRHEYDGKTCSWHDVFVMPPKLFCSKCGKVIKV